MIWNYSGFPQNHNGGKYFVLTLHEVNTLVSSVAGQSRPTASYLRKRGRRSICKETDGCPPEVCIFGFVTYPEGYTDTVFWEDKAGHGDADKDWNIALINDRQRRAAAGMVTLDSMDTDLQIAGITDTAERGLGFYG